MWTLRLSLVSGGLRAARPVVAWGIGIVLSSDLGRPAQVEVLDRGRLGQLAVEAFEHVTDGAAHIGGTQGPPDTVAHQATEHAADKQRRR